MPFINEQLKHNQQKNVQAKLEQATHYVSRFKFDPANVISLLRSNIIGQDTSLNKIERQLITLKADFAVANKPLGVVLLLGPTGVGKTETARLIAQGISGDANALCRIDMNTLAQEHYSAALLGSPPGYVGSKEGHTLFDKEKIQGTFSVPGIVLLDEIEKADQKVVRAIMNILDTGKLTINSGQAEIDFTNSLIFMTSNLGAREVDNWRNKFGAKLQRFLKIKSKQPDLILDKALSKHFDPEFINRIDDILTYSPLTRLHLNDLLMLEVNLLNKRLSKKGISLELTQSCCGYILEKFNGRYGARHIKRIIKKEIEPELAITLLQNPYAKHFCITIHRQTITCQPSVMNAT